MQTFPNFATSLVKLDLTFEAGSRYQPQLCVAHAASQLICEATTKHTAEEVAEFIDFRGIVIERCADASTSCLSFYFLRRYASELLPLMREMVETPELTPQMFSAFVSKRRQQLETSSLKTSYVARNVFYESLFGPDHPLGVHACPEDADRLSPQLIIDFWRERYRFANAFVTLSGHVDDELVSIVNDNLYPNRNENPHPTPKDSQFLIGTTVPNSQFAVVPSAVQASIRVGRILPFGWNDPDPVSGLTLYSRFMVLNTVLGGYFGSRLMSSLREEKGYTYGVYSQTQIFRGFILMYITADVAADVVTDALAQVDAEMRRLQEQRVGDEELRRVCTYMRGDHLRSIDGVFELAERHRQMATTGIDDRFFDYFQQALGHTTPADLQRLARQVLSPAEMLHVVAGPSAMLKEGVLESGCS